MFAAAAKSNIVNLKNQLLQRPDLLKSFTEILQEFKQKKHLRNVPSGFDKRSGLLCTPFFRGKETNERNFQM